MMGVLPSGLNPANIVIALKSAGLQTFPATGNVQEELFNLSAEELDEQFQLEEFPDSFRGGIAPGDGIPYDTDPLNPPEPPSWRVPVPTTSLSEPQLRARYFQDGSLRTFLVGQFVEPGSGTTPPLLAPIQVASLGAQVVELLSNGQYQCHSQAIHAPLLVPLVPALFPQADWVFRSVLQLWDIRVQGRPPSRYYLANTLEQQQSAMLLSSNQMVKLSDFATLRTRGTAAANREMRLLEMWMSDQMVQTNLSNDPTALLIVDGTLMFPLRDMTKRASWLQVVGVSKNISMTPLIYRRGPNDSVGTNLMTALQNLKAGERTRAFYILNDYQIAWYLRLHDVYLPERTGGIIKVEMTSAVVQQPLGFSSLEALVNAVSANLLRLRYPTAPRSNRWDRHLYPIYVAERSLKAAMPSQQQIVPQWSNLF